MTKRRSKYLVGRANEDTEQRKSARHVDPYWTKALRTRGTGVGRPSRGHVMTIRNQHTPTFDVGRWIKQQAAGLRPNASMRSQLEASCCRLVQSQVDQSETGHETGAASLDLQATLGASNVEVLPWSLVTGQLFHKPRQSVPYTYMNHVHSLLL